MNNILKKLLLFIILSFDLIFSLFLVTISFRVHTFLVRISYFQYEDKFLDNRVLYIRSDDFYIIFYTEGRIGGKKETIDRLYIGWRMRRRNSFGSLSRCRGRQCSVALVATTARLVSGVKWTIVEKLLPLWSYDRFNFAVVTRSLTFWVNTRIPFVVISVIIYLLIASSDSTQNEIDFK